MVLFTQPRSGDGGQHCDRGRNCKSEDRHVRARTYWKQRRESHDSSLSVEVSFCICFPGSSGVRVSCVRCQWVESDRGAYMARVKSSVLVLLVLRCLVFPQGFGCGL